MKFELKQTINRKENFTISATQQGNRLGRERLKTGTFEPTPIKIILKNSGRIVARCYARNFNNFLEVDDIDLEPGMYEIDIEPVWNPCAETDSDYKVLCIDLFCKEKVTFYVEV